MVGASWHIYCPERTQSHVYICFYLQTIGAAHQCHWCVGAGYNKCSVPVAGMRVLPVLEGFHGTVVTGIVCRANSVTPAQYAHRLISHCGSHKGYWYRWSWQLLRLSGAAVDGYPPWYSVPRESPHTPTAISMSKWVSCGVPLTPARILEVPTPVPSQCWAGTGALLLWPYEQLEDEP